MRYTLFMCRIFSKTIYILFACLICQFPSAQQIPCEIPEWKKSKKIRVVFHFVSDFNKERNFTRKKNQYNLNGKKWAKQIIKKANEQLGSLKTNWKSPKQTIQIIDAGFRYKLKGVKYINDDEYARIDNYLERASNKINKRYGKKRQKMINVYFFEEYFRGMKNGGGLTNRSHKAEEVFIKMYNYGWTKYHQYGGEEWIQREEAATFNHEIGHLLGLDHDWLEDDGMPDTMPYNERSCESDKGIWENCSNNFMSIPPKYSSLEGSFTMCQVARMYEALIGERKNYVK